MNKIYIFIAAMVFTIVGFFFLSIQKVNNIKYRSNYKPPFIKRPYGSALPKEPAALPNEWMGYQRTYPYGIIKHEIQDSLKTNSNAMKIQFLNIQTY